MLVPNFTLTINKRNLNLHSMLYYQPSMEKSSQSLKYFITEYHQSKVRFFRPKNERGDHKPLPFATKQSRKQT